jgi:hypothetical protein
MKQRWPLVLIGVLLIAVVVKYTYLWLGGDSAAPVAASQESPALALKRLENMRLAAAAVPGKEELYKQASADLAEREKGLLKAENRQQAQVALLELVQNVARSNGIDARGNQEFRDKVVNSDYGEVSVTVTFNCGIEQLVNMLTAIGNQPETLATNEIHVSGGNDKQKKVSVRLSVSAAVPRKLIPEKKGVAAF